MSPGQWVYRVVENEATRTRPDGRPNTGTEGQALGNGRRRGDLRRATTRRSVDVGDNIPSYSELGSLPRDPAALDAYLARLVYPDSNPAPDIKGLAAFSVIEDMLTNYVLPPTLEAEMYQALAILPGIEVDSHVTAIDGQSGVAFVLPPTPQSEQTRAHPRRVPL